MKSPRDNEPLPPQFMGTLAFLPPHAHGNRSLTWWGMMGLVAIESTAFVLAIAAYFYLATHSAEWPPDQLVPSVAAGNVFSVISVLSLIPNLWLKRVAEAEKLKQVQIGLIVMSVVGLALMPVRYFEFASMHVSWADSAYGSIVITILALHTVHLVTDLYDTLVLTALMFTKHAKGRRFVDVAENALYWNFVVVAWFPIYAVLYLAPRFL